MIVENKLEFLTSVPAFLSECLEELHLSNDKLTNVDLDKWGNSKIENSKDLQQFLDVCPSP